MSGSPRYLDDLGPDLGEATVALVDALRDYIRAREEVKDDWIFPDDDAEEARRLNALHDQTCKQLLEELEDWEVDATLRGIVNRKK
jgi:hypothetical protein